MTNEEKAKELAFESPQCQIYIDNKCNQNFPCDRFKVALEMAQWKDEQQWKPTEKQLDALLDCANNSTRKNFLELNSLYEELVKLYYDKR